MRSIARIAAPLFVLFSLAPAWGQAVSLAHLSAYLNGITEAEAHFTQANADGSRSSGVLYLHRPGRMRFQYDPPNKTLVIAAGGAVAVFDPKSNQPPLQYPLANTPLNLILAARVDLGAPGVVVAHRADGANTVVVAQDPAHPDYGQITLVFSDKPIALRQWIVTDAMGGRTVVTLSGLRPVQQLGDSLFDITAATQQRRGR